MKQTKGKSRRRRPRRRLRTIGPGGVVRPASRFSAENSPDARFPPLSGSIPSPTPPDMLTGADVAQHASQSDLWMIIQGNVYDLTEFAPSHPGGLKILLKYAGKDATEEYEPIHPPGTIEEALKKEHHLGPVDMSTVEKVVVEEVKKPVVGGAITSLEECLNLDDIEKAAESRLKTKAWAYYASAADDEYTKNKNHDIYKQIRLRPRVLVDVTNADLRTTILGHESSLPFFIAPAALGKLAHPDGEHLLAKVAGQAGIPYMVSANASCSFTEIAEAASPEQTLFYQVYVNRDRKKTEEQLRKVKQLGYKAICVTVDAPVAGKRERDERSKMDSDSANDPGMKKAAGDKGPAQGIANTMGAYVDASLSWTDLSWLKSVSSLPLIVKGIQCAEDAALAVSYGADAIYLSNHGGRQLEGANTAIETLLEIRQYEAWILKKAEVYVDGGIRRGTDILKALALGATAVGVGRPFMYSLTFGQAGVATVTNILKGELEQNLRLMGASKLSELTPAMLNTRELESYVYDGYVSPIKFWSKL